MQVKGMVRMRQGTLDDVRARYGDIDEGTVRRAVRGTPGWAELRYLRSFESLQSAGAGRREYALLWVIATIDGQHGFALDVVGQWETLFGADETTAVMRDESVSRIRAAHKAHQRTLGLRKRALGFVRRFIPHALLAAPGQASGTPKRIDPRLQAGGGGPVSAR
jgi:hypothetical protein